MVTINPLPTLTITNPAAVCSPATVDITAAAVTAGSSGSLTLTYFTDAAGTIALATPAAVATSGTYYIKGTLGTGCSLIKPVVVTINPLPTLTITNPAAVCSPATVDLTAAAVTAGSSGGLTLTYFTDAAGTIALATPTAVATSGTYYIKGTLGTGCSVIKPVVVTINLLPTATINYAGSPFCATGTATVTRTGQAGGAYTSAPAGLSINAATGDINLATSTPSATPYTITYTFTNGTCSNTTTTTVLVNALPTATINYAGSPFCATGTATVTRTGQAGGAYTSAPAGLSLNAATGDINLATSTPSATPYTITYTFTNGTCSNTTTTTVLINALPTLTISNPAAVCSPATVDITTVAVTVGSSPGLTFTYFTDAAGTIALATPAAVATSGTYYIKGTLGTGCSVIKPVVVTINPLPTATISYTGSPFCATGTATVTRTGQAGGTYTSAPAGLSLNAATGDINLATSTPSATPYTITYTFTNGTCSNTTTTTVLINALPTLTITNPAVVCSPATVDITATAVTFGSTPGLTFTYFTDAAGTIALATPAAVATSGTYYIKGTLGTGCSMIKPVVVTINPLPTAAISYTGSPFCATGTATVTRTGQAGGAYTSAPAGLSLNAATGDINLATSTPSATPYTITYTFTNGTCSNTTTTTVLINALPTATINYAGSPFCATGTATVTRTGQAGGAYTSAPAGLSINAATGDINLATSTPSATPYTITYTFTNGTCSNTTTTTVLINALPTATINYAGSPFCATGTATVTRTGQAGGTYTSAPAGLSLNAATGDINLATSTPSATPYTITYTFTNGTCSNTTTTTVLINALPIATINYAGSPFCATGTATVTRTGQAGGTYTSAPAGLSLNAATGDINLATSTPSATPYTITYTFTNGTCSNTTTTTVLINALPIATINYAGSPFCATGTATVTRTGQAGGTYTSAPAGLSLNAATGDINLATSTPSATPYTITYTFTNGTCSNTTTTTVLINALPIATINYAGSPFCATGTATVTRTGQAGGTYTSAPAGLSLNAATGDINLATSTPSATPYTITYTFTNGTCSNTTTTTVLINALPTATINYAGSPFCATGTATVTRTGQAGGTYTSAPAGLSLNAATGDINLATSTPSATPYTITYTFTNGTCSNTTITTVLINALPTATINYAGSPFCATGTATVTRTGQAGGSYTSAPAGLSLNAATGDINLATSTPSATPYTITYTFTNGTCSNTTTTTVLINALPTATINYAGSPFCATGTATVTRTGQAGGTYTSAPAGLSINAATGDINLATSTPSATPYTITYTFTNGTCSNTTTTTVLINALPTLAITDPTAVCSPSTVDITATAVTFGSTPGLTFTYFTDAAGTITLATPAAVATSGTYYIKGTLGTGCSVIKPVVVTINLLPTLTITNPAVVCSPATVDITATAVTFGSTPGLTFTYFTDAAGTIALATPAAVATSGTYYIKGTLGTGCSMIKPVVVTINPLPTAAISYTGSPFCATGTATVTRTGQAGGAYTSAPAGLSINAATGDINLATSTPSATPYTITYTFTNGTCSNTTTTTVLINALPTATINYAGSPFCATGTATVTRTGQAGGIYTSAPAGLSINAATGDINLATSTPSATPYTITYTFTNGTCSNTTTTTVLINALPIATINYAGSPFCATGTATGYQNRSGRWRPILSAPRRLAYTSFQCSNGRY